MISKRKLLKWRKEALLDKQLKENNQLKGNYVTVHQSHNFLYADKVLELTQELIDQHLLKEEK